jgi:hypothetical protein
LRAFVPVAERGLRCRKRRDVTSEHRQHTRSGPKSLKGLSLLPEARIRLRLNFSAAEDSSTRQCRAADVSLPKHRRCRHFQASPQARSRRLCRQISLRLTAARTVNQPIPTVLHLHRVVGMAGEEDASHVISLGERCRWLR